MHQHTEIASDFIGQALNRMEENFSKTKRCLDILNEDDIWKRPNASSNSIGNQILHLCGNITQYIISALGGVDDNRERDKEFEAQEGFTKEELYNRFESTVNRAMEVIRAIEDDATMMKIRSVQGFEFTGIGIILHVVEHFSYHTGQIVFYTKMLKDKDMGFYANIDLNQKNKF